MKATLVVPAGRAYPLGLKMELKLDTEHPASNYGIGVLLPACAVAQPPLDGAVFESYHEILAATIETDDVAAVAAALGLPADHPGLVRLL